jgi:predicted phage terminase large subunit-like protein
VTALASATVAETRFHVVEDHVIVLSGSTVCPSPDVCDLRDDETYEEYVRRHVADHGLPERNPQTGEAWSLIDAERNLSLWCLYYFHKWIQGNMSLLPHPCWQDADFLANGRFTDEDLEVGVPWDKRQFTLKPYSERVVDLARYKRMRKMTKVRETQKSSWSKALITWRHLRAHFVERNIYFRVMVISARSALARDSYLEVFKVMWATHAKLVELFGTTVKTRRWREDMDADERDAEERPLGLLDWKKSKLKDGLQLRWNVASKQNTGQTVTSLFVAGVTTATAGRRWDLIVVDDPCVPENSSTEQQRAKVKAKTAELRKELSAIGELVWLNTPHALGDASQEIDEKYQDEFHILYRPARWGEKGNYSYYWERDGICAVKVHGIPCDRPRHEHRSCHAHGEITDHSFMGRVVWSAERIEREERQLDFYSQVLLLVRDERHAMFSEKDFPIVPTSSTPEEIRFGLGRPLNEDERMQLETQKVSILAFNQIDTAGKERQTTRGDRNVIVGVRFDRYGIIYITHIHYGFWTPEMEIEAMWASCVRNQPSVFEYEVSGAHEKYARGAINDWQGRKSMELKRPVGMPVIFINASEGSVESKRKRIEKVQPYAATGRVRILADAGSEEDIRLLIREFQDFPWSDHDDGPDAFSRVLKRLDAQSFEAAPEVVETSADLVFDPATGQLLVGETVIAGFDDGASAKAWGDQGYPATDERPWVDNDSIPSVGKRRAVA